MAFWGLRQPANLPRAFGPSDKELALRVKASADALNKAVSAARDAGLEVHVEVRRCGASEDITGNSIAHVHIRRTL